MLKVEDLRVFHGSVEAVKGIDIHIPPGEIVYIMGRNGSGKTSMIKALMGLLPSQGRVYLENEDISTLPSYVRGIKGIGYVPEQREVFSNLTVEENLKVFMKKGESKWPLGRVYDLFPSLKKLKGRKAGALSGGEQEMVSIGRALTRDPKFLILDEPFEGLAPIVVKALEELFPIIKGEITVLLTEQNEKSAVQFADQVYMMDRGKLKLL